ncbi:glycoside hydrolase family 3 C-terminal domain-containing protein [Mycolicibacterium sp. S2-37]|uniref:glycoside hydrolase family 3 C-terminal domain-containing protein n=1 Tax=Mycolicibacterium sp. S2-37 TaxID=2810297 RepID=UPI001A946AED|nr:glycoside hydrolase family 3 C-terminal domain-containing protein [Mycolicibacterium sp. S2-37]
MPESRVAEWSLAERTALGSGADFWSTRAVRQVPAIVLTDGPHGVRLQTENTTHLDIGSNRPATCFPPAVGQSHSWDPELIRRIGVALGRESQALGVHVLLGPGVNIKRDPRCGRNFEYYSEDPLLSGVLGAAWVAGLQSEGVGACVKHFAVNNQETDRFLVSADVDARALREVYLRTFQRIVTEAQPWSVMASYNRINGVYATENHWLLTEVLRDEWGFQGAVVSDWGAVAHRPAAVAAGLDLEMPGWGPESDREVTAAVEAGDLDAACVARAADRITALATRATAAHRPDATFDVDEHHALAREAAVAGIVLLCNDGDLLPFDPAASLAVVGHLAEQPRFQGGGSSHMTPTRLDIPLDELRSRASGAVTYAPGYPSDGSGDAAALRQDAARHAASADAAVLFLGLPESADSEGSDRVHIDLPAEQIELLAEVAAAQPRTAVVVMRGGVVALSPLLSTARAIVDTALLGQGGGAAIADVLLGAVNPSGKLTETVPVLLEDVPAYLDFPGSGGRVRYSESLHVGYRWYDARALAVAFPFGHGLSYTTFEYGDLTLEQQHRGVTARVAVANTGARAGREVVQFYAAGPGAPHRRLVGFGSATIEPGAHADVEVFIPRGEFAHWDERVDRFVVGGGRHTIWAGASSRDLRAVGTVTVEGDAVAVPLSLDTAIGDLLAHPAADALLAKFSALMGLDQPMDVPDMALGIPLGRLAAFSGGLLSKARLRQALEEVQQPDQG